MVPQRGVVSGGCGWEGEVDADLSPVGAPGGELRCPSFVSASEIFRAATLSM